ncbi:MAG TPA: Ig-like domain-containing protein [Longimicrobiales bacterium]|jgi:hypothetical protein
MSSNPGALRALFVLCAAAAASLLACGDGGTGPKPEPWTVTSIQVSPPSATLRVGETRQLTASVQATGSPPGSTTWSSAPTGVVTVSGNGLVTAVAPGLATVTAAAGGKSASSQITVNAATPAAPASAQATPASHTEVDVTWTDQSTNETTFRIERETGSAAATSGTDGPTRVYATVATVQAGVTEYRDEGLEPATTYRYRIAACDGEDCSAPSNVAEVTTDEELVILTSTLAGAGVGEAYQKQIEAAGGGGTLTWTVSAGALPPGLALAEETGMIAGTPTAEGDFDFTVRVAARGQTASVDLSITVGTFGTVALTVFQDDDRDAVLDVGESGVEGVAVIFLDSGDGSAVQSLVSDGDGLVEASLPVGGYMLRVEPVPGLIGDPLVVPDLLVEVTDQGPTEAVVPLVPGAQADIDEAGGVLEGPGGEILTVPPGALEQATTLSLVPVDVAFDASVFQGVELHPAGLALGAPVEVRLPLDAGEPEGGQFFYLDGALGEALWEPTLVDAEAGSGTLFVTHFSPFFFDPDWVANGALAEPGPRDWSLASLPSSLAGSGTPAEAADDLARGIGRWKPALDALGSGLTRNDDALAPVLVIAAMDLGPCGADGTVAGRSGRLARLARSGVLYLNDACLWSTSPQLTRDEPSAVSLEGVVAHQVGHLLGLGHLSPGLCEPATGAALPECGAPPTLSVLGAGDLGPLWADDLGLFRDVHGLTGDWAAMGVAGLRPTDDWVDGQEMAVRTLLGTPPGVVVFDHDGDPVAGVTVLFQALSGDPDLDGTVAVTGADGIARLGSWRTDRDGGTEVVGASFFLPPGQTAANDAVGALERFTVDVVEPPPPVVEDFFPLEVGRFFRYAWERVPVDGSDPTSGEGVDEVTAVTMEDDVTWYEMTGDGPVGDRCGDSLCELGVDPVAGRAPLRVTVETGGDPLVILTRLLQEPVETGESWSDTVLIVTFNWTILNVGNNLTVRGKVYQDVVHVRGTATGQTGRVDFFLAEGVGVVKVVGVDATATTTFELIETGVS